MTSTPAGDIPLAVPTAIVRKLRRVLWRLRMVALLRGVLAVAAVAGASVLVVVAVDVTVPSVSASPRLRWAMTILALCLTLWAVVRYLLRPLRRSFSLAGVARMIELRHPEMQERISSAVELLTSSDSAELRGSSQLIHALAIQAGRDAKAVAPRREVTHRRTGPFVAASVAVALVIWAMLVVWPDRGLRLLTRAVAPFANEPNVYAEDLTISPGDCTLMEGDLLRVEVLVAAGAAGGVQFRKRVDSSDVVRAMTETQAPADDEADAQARQGDPARPRRTRAAPRRFVFISQPVAAGFRYRIRASDAWSKYYTVAVIPRPRVSAVAVTYNYLPYTGRDRHTDHKGKGDIFAPAGTEVTVEVRTACPITGAEVKLGNGRLDEKDVAVGREAGTCTFSFALDAKTPPTWSVRPIRRIGKQVFAGERVEHSVEIEPDARPAVDVVVDRSRGSSLTLNRQDRPVITYHVSDDFAVGGAELLVEVDGRTVKPGPLDLTVDPDGLWSGTTVLDLPALGSGTAQMLTFQVRARDNRPAKLGGPQEGRSELFQVAFDDEASFLRVQVRVDDELLIRQILLEALKNLKAAKTDSQALRKGLAGGGDLADGDAKRVDTIRTLLGEVHTPLRELIAEITGGTYGGLIDELVKINAHVGRGRALAGELKVTDDAKARGDLADEADFEIGRALTLVTDILRHFQALADAVMQAETLVGLSEEQRILAELAAQLGGAQAPGEIDVQSLGWAMTPEEFGKLQAKLSGDVAAMVRQAPAALAIVAARDLASTQSMIARLRKLSEKQAAIRRRTLQGDAVDGQLAALAAGQRALAAQARAQEATKPQGAPMVAAATRIEIRDIAGAVAGQKKIEARLVAASRGLRARAAAVLLAEQARATALEQDQVAAQVEALAKTIAVARAAAAAQAAKAARARTAAAKQRAGLAPRLSALGGRQEALAAQAARAPAAKAMAQAAASLKAGDAAKALEHARTAANQAAETAGRLARAAASAPATPALDKQVAAAVKAAGASAQAADKAAAAARAARTQAAEAEKQARAAESKAKQAASGDDKAAAQAAAKEADARRKAADAARAAADVRARASAAAAKTAADAAAKRKGLESQRGVRRRGIATAAKAAADAAAAVVRQQKAVQSDAAKLAAAAAPLAAVLLAAEQADRERAAQLKRAELAGKQLPALAARQQKVADSAKAVAKSAAGSMQQAAAAMSAGKTAEAAKAARAAAGLADRQAKALAAAAGIDAKPVTSSLLSAAARHAAVIGTRQAVLRKLTEQLLAGRRKFVTAELARISALQEVTAMRAGDLASSVAAGWPQDDRLQTKAAQAARDAVESLDAGRADQAAIQARQAAKQLDELAGRLGGSDTETEKGDPRIPAAATPDEATPAALDAGQNNRARGMLAATARELARTQDNLARQIDAVAAGGRLGMLTARQGALASEVAEVADDAELLSDHAEELGLGEEEANLADAAARLVDDAAHRAAGTAGKLTQIAGRPVPKPTPTTRPTATTKPAPKPRPTVLAAAEQAQVSASLDKAAEKLAALGKLLNERAEQSTDEEEPMDPEDLADAYEAAAEAARAPSDAERAARLLSNLADASLEMAQSLGADVRLAGLVMAGDRTRPGRPGGRIGPLGKSRARWVSRARLKMGELGISTDVWARLSGQLRSEILQGGKGGGPAEYRQYSKWYFRELARRAAAAALTGEKNKKKEGEK